MEEGRVNLQVRLARFRLDQAERKLDDAVGQAALKGFFGESASSLIVHLRYDQGPKPISDAIENFALRQLITEAVHAILAKISGESITDETSLNDLHLDSLDKIQVAVDLEEAFSIEIPDDDIDDPRLGYAAGIVAYVEGKVGMFHHSV